MPAHPRDDSSDDGSCPARDPCRADSPHLRRGIRVIHRRATATGVGLLLLTAVALAATQPTQAVPGSAGEPLVASFAPVWPGGQVADARTAPTPAGASARPAAIPDGGEAPVPTGRPRVRQPAPAAGVTVKRIAVKRTPVRRIAVSHSIRGRASWYCRAGVSTCMAAPPERAGVADMYAAAGPGLRRAICGSDTSNCWRGRTVVVNGVAVVLADWCQCYKGEGNEKLIDLYWDAWSRVPGVESGVTIGW
jgi:hypothetical protein